MKATLIAAALLIPTLVLANDPSTKNTKDTKDTYGQGEAQKTPSDVLNKLHKISQVSFTDTPLRHFGAFIHDGDAVTHPEQILQAVRDQNN